MTSSSFRGLLWQVLSAIIHPHCRQIKRHKERLTDSGLKTFWITYPTAKREFGDSITTEFEKNFSF